MSFHVVLKFLVLLKGSSAQVAGIRLIPGVGPTDVAVVGGVGGEGLPAVLTLEGPLSGVLTDVCSQDAGGGEGLEEEDEVSMELLLSLLLFVQCKMICFWQQKAQ